MKNHIPTIEELLSKPKGELEAIFRRAASTAADTTRPPQERVAAIKTIDVVRRCLWHPPGV